MRRLILLLAAATLVAGPLATAGDALGKDRREAPARREPAAPRGEQGRGQQGRQAPPQAWRGGEYRGAPAYEGRGYPQVDPRSDPRYGYRPDPRYDPRAYAAPPNAAARRGGYMPPGARGEVIQDPSRLRLRPPPRGYEWVQTQRGWAMVSQSTGQVFDVVPY